MSAGLLCQSDGTTPLVDTAGHSIPDLTNGGSTIIGQNDFERIHTQTLGRIGAVDQHRENWGPLAMPLPRVQRSTPR